MQPADGGCLCGGVRFRIGAAPTGSGYCHCRFCQLNSGAPVDHLPRHDAFMPSRP